MALLKASTSGSGSRVFSRFRAISKGFNRTGFFVRRGRGFIVNTPNYVSEAMDDLRKPIQSRFVQKNEDESGGKKHIVQL
jgi:hypothetical protein